jgi:L-alanine-DL-glutamate epimerase-like enolase superfamily enzyme
MIFTLNLHISYFCPYESTKLDIQAQIPSSFTISKGTKTHQPTFIVELEHFGIKGYGEAPAIAYYNIPVEKMAEDLEAKKNIRGEICFYRT